MKRLLLAAAAACALAACDQPSGPSPARAQWALAEARRADAAAVQPTPDANTAAQNAATEAAITADLAAADAAVVARDAYVGEPVPSRFTKAQFDHFIYGKTKPQIRALFGSPLVVHDDSNEWFYNDLPIYDADAGTQTGVSIRFAYLGGSNDEVVEVRF